MKFFITGGSGFVGTELVTRLLGRGDEVTVIGRSPGKPHRLAPAVRYLAADVSRQGRWQDEVSAHDVVVNLAGESIFKRWTARNKRAIMESRTLTTRNLVEAMGRGRPAILCSASAVGYYGLHGDETLNEADPPGTDFLAQVCVHWEREALKAAPKGTRVVITRFGMVLGKSGGALAKMVPAFRMGLGGPLGSGRQWTSWIHLDDLVSALLFAVDHHGIEGPLNFCSPNPVRNRHLARSLGRVLHRPSFFRTPGWVMKLVMGEFGAVLLKGQRVLPGRLLEHGFTFSHIDIEDALYHLLG